ncbi:MAG: S8 family serine peptidase [bacterium]|nr:S8 family serine peptidase [bacterium]
MHGRVTRWSIVGSACLAMAVCGCADKPGEPVSQTPQAKATTDGSPTTGKIKITKLDDLPQHSYPVDGTLADLVRSKKAIAALAAEVRADLDANLATYQVDDATTLQRWYGALLTLDMLEGNHDAALTRVEQIRQLEDKDAQKLTIGLTVKAMIAARQTVGPDAPEAAYQRTFRRLFAEEVAALPWDIVQDTVQQSKGRAEILSENLLMGVVDARLQPAVTKTGELDFEAATSVLSIHYTIDARLPLRDEIVAVFQDYIDANKTVKPDIWAERAVTLSADQKLATVLAAVWDSGVDPDLFEGRMWVNPYEKSDGTDTDQNGFIDDVHGIAFNIHAMRTTGALRPLGDVSARVDQLMDHLKGFSDLQAAVDSPEAAALKKHLRELGEKDFQGFLEDLGLIGGYVHGTHVAGIMAEGNPFVQLLIGRHSYDNSMVPVARTFDWGGRDATKCRDSVKYFSDHGVRVVNMSWGEAQEDAEASLRVNGIGKTAEARRDLARTVFSMQKQGLHDAIEGAPDILFVCAAGNADNDVEFDEYIPSSFDLPNLVVVGAVDQAGDPTSFTSFGRTVKVYANGFEVDSVVPGGRRMKLSGTSMASPNVANLAAKMIAINPGLTPPDVIRLIEEGADRRTVGEQSFLLINPQRTIKLLEQRG